jgi:hypothetical protein
MMPMLEALANNVSALPTSASVAPSFSSASGSGGFAATLAAAQAQSATPQSGSSNGQGSDLPDSNGSASGETTNQTLVFTNHFNVRAAASGNIQLRKSTGNSASNSSLAVALAGAAVVNSPLPEPIPVTAVPLVPAIPIATTTPLSVASTQTNVSLPNLLQANAPQSGAQQSNLLQSTTPQSGLPQPNFPATLFLVTAASQTPESLPSPESSSLHAAASGIFTATGATTESDAQKPLVGSTAAPANVMAPATTTSPAPENRSSSVDWNGLQNNWGSAEPVMVAENTAPAALSSAFRQSASSTLSANAGKDSQWSSNVSGPAAAVPSAQNQTADAEPPSTNFLMSAFPGAVLQESLPSSADAGQTGESNSSSNVAQSGVTSSDLSAEAEAGIPISGNTAASIPGVSIIPNAPVSNAQTPNAALLNLAAQLLSSKAPLQVAAPPPTTAPNGSGVRGASARPDAPVSTLTSALAAGSNSGAVLPVASQTPFSVFFLNAGPGAESAALALPKIVTPVAASASHLTNALATGRPGATLPQVSSQNNSSQNAVPQNSSSKDALSGTSSGNLQTAQALRRETDSSITGLAVASSQATATTVVAPPAPTGGTVSPVALAADSAAKPESLPAPAPESAAIVAPAPPPTLPTAVTGPVQVAQMVNRIGQSEMRIGMNTTAFGTVDVRTVVHASDVGLVIGSEKGDLRGLMTNEMPSISNSLQQQNLRLNSVNFMQGSASSGNGNGSGGGDSQQRFFVPRGSSNFLLPEPVDDSVETASASEYGSSRGLSILA